VIVDMPEVHRDREETEREKLSCVDVIWAMIGDVNETVSAGAINMAKILMRAGESIGRRAKENVG